MSLNCGIVGLPNVGKSTLFNALLGLEKANVSNYPFCTIDPNRGIIALEDERLQKLSDLSRSKKTVNTGVQFVDIAGLIKGASKGEGLGNKFLANIREVDAIIHVCRCFLDKDIHHVSDNVDPVSDLAVVETELKLADMQTLEKSLQKAKQASKKQQPQETVNENLIRKIMKSLDIDEKLTLSDDELDQVKSLHLLSIKPEIYVCNVSEEDVSRDNALVLTVREYAQSKNRACIRICAKLENEIANLSNAKERQEFLSSMGIVQSGLQQIAGTMYHMLGLITFFTTGVQETRAWAMERDKTAAEAAGVIHSDFQKRFIKAEVVSYKDFVRATSFVEARALGLARFEGKDYIVQDGDVIYFHHNA